MDRDKLAGAASERLSPAGGLHSQVKYSAGAADQGLGQVRPAAPRGREARTEAERVRGRAGEGNALVEGVSLKRMRVGRA